MTNGRGCAPPSSLPQRPGCSCHTASSSLFPPISSPLLLLQGWDQRREGWGWGTTGAWKQDRYQVFFQLARHSLRVPCVFCFLSAQAPCLSCCRSHYRAPLWTVPALRDISGSSFALCCTSYEGRSPVGIGVHMYRHQHTGVRLLGHKKCHTLDTCRSFQSFVLMHMGGMVLADKLGNSLSLRVFT